MVCSRTWPAYIESVRNIERYQEEMEEILYGDLPTVLPGFQVSDLVQILGKTIIIYIR